MLDLETFHESRKPANRGVLCMSDSVKLQWAPTSTYMR